MRALPLAPESANVRALALHGSERYTGLVGVTLTLVNEPAQTVNGDPLELVIKNGTVLDSTSDYVLTGRTITLAVPAIPGDVFRILSPYRA